MIRELLTSSRLSMLSMHVCSDSYTSGGESMLNVGQLNEGVVLDHIEAGKSMSIYHYLKLDQLDCCVAIIKNARSNKMGKKDIIKVKR